MDADEIAPGLWVGATPMPLREAHGRYFDYVAACAYELQPQPSRTVGVIRVPLDDAVPSRREIVRALDGARVVNKLRSQRQRVLVCCAQGRNRSAWVAAMCLMQDGCSAEAAISELRTKRQPRNGPVLSNEAFVQVLRSLDKHRAFAR